MILPFLEWVYMKTKSNHADMPNDYFKFKQFKITQGQCAMKVGTDGVMIGAWTNMGRAKHVLDIGTGTGLIALMMAQRSVANIHAIEIEPQACIQATKNINASKWSDRISVENVSLQEYNSKGLKYDLIVSNPPYFDNMLKNRDAKKSMARHTHQLSYIELIEYTAMLLLPEGRLSFIFPMMEFGKIENMIRHNKLHINRLCHVYPKPGTDAIRCMIECSFKNKGYSQEKLTIEENKRHNYSIEFTNLVKDFYLYL